MQGVIEPIPEDLQDFLNYVSRLIRSGADSARTPSDDLIQRDCAYGGLSDNDVNLYCFRYFPGEDGVTTWDFSLLTEDIHAIANGEVKVLELWGCDSGRCSNRFMSEDGYCEYCTFWAERNLRRPACQDEEACGSQTEWLQLFASVNPQATGMDAYDAYISTPGLEVRLGQLPVELMAKERPIG